MSPHQLKKKRRAPAITTTKTISKKKQQKFQKRATLKKQNEAAPIVISKAASKVAATKSAVAKRTHLYQLLLKRMVLLCQKSAQGVESLLKNLVSCQRFTKIYHRIGLNMRKEPILKGNRLPRRS